MSLDEEKIRRSLSARPIRSGDSVWPEVRGHLEARLHAPLRARLALTAVAILILAATLWRRHAPPPVSPTGDRPGFTVSRVESRGRPSAALVLRPDPDTLMVVVPD